MARFDFMVHGTPGPQGSKRALGSGRMIEMSKRVKPWREAVKWAWVAAKGHKIEGPVRLCVTFYFARPTSVNRSRPSVPPDLSKLIRATEDALTDVGAWEDDSRVVSIAAEKYYESGFCGADISIEAAYTPEIVIKPKVRK